MSDASQPGSVKKLNTKPTTMPGSVMTFGSSWCSRSIAKSTISAQPKTRRDASSSAGPVHATTRSANISAVSASTIG